MEKEDVSVFGFQQIDFPDFYELYEMDPDFEGMRIFTEEITAEAIFPKKIFQNNEKSVDGYVYACCMTDFGKTVSIDLHDLLSGQVDLSKQIHPNCIYIVTIYAYTYGEVILIGMN